MKPLIPFLFLFVACSPKETDQSVQARSEIISADKAMSAMATKDGFFKALLLNSDEEVIKLKEGEWPVVGKSNLEKYWKGKKDTKEISWEPFKAEAAKSGEMGYTLGVWKFTAPDSTYYGNYYTFWKRQQDGKWKFVLDGGNGTPASK